VAHLVILDDNPHDPNAVGVMLDGKPAGYIPRTRSAAFRDAVIAINPDAKPVICKAEIMGGFVKGRDRGSYGITLDIAEPLRIKMR